MLSFFYIKLLHFRQIGWNCSYSKQNIRS